MYLLTTPETSTAASLAASTRWPVSPSSRSSRPCSTFSKLSRGSAEAASGDLRSSAAAGPTAGRGAAGDWGPEDWGPEDLGPEDLGPEIRSLIRHLLESRRLYPAS